MARELSLHSRAGCLAALLARWAHRKRTGRSLPLLAIRVSLSTQRRGGNLFPVLRAIRDLSRSWRKREVPPPLRLFMHTPPSLPPLQPSRPCRRPPHSPSPNLPLPQGSWSSLGPPRSVGSQGAPLRVLAFLPGSPRLASCWIPVRFSAVCAPRAPTKTTVGSSLNSHHYNLLCEFLTGNHALPPGLVRGT